MSTVIVKDADGNDKHFATYGAGTLANPYFSIPANLNLEVSKGNVPFNTVVDKYGENPEVDILSSPEDIWEVGGLYVYDADGTAPIVSLISDNAGDSQDIKITGLDINGNEVAQTVTLNGTTRVALTTALWRVYRMENEGTTDISGEAYVYIGTGGVPTSGDTRAKINNGNNQTLMAIYTIPKGKVGFLVRGEIGLSRNKDGDVEASYNSRRLGKIFKIKKRVSIVTSGSSVYQDERSFPDVIPSFTDIRLTVNAVSKDDFGIFGAFDILLINETQFSNAYLVAIGQPGA